MFDFLFYLVFSLSLFISTSVKAIVSQWKISMQVSNLANDEHYSNDFCTLFFAQVFERFTNSKFNIFTLVNLFFAFTCQTFISSLNYFLDGLSTNQKSEANKKFISMILKDLLLPFFFLTRSFFEYSYSTTFMFIFPIPFLLRYLAFLTRSFVDGLSISSKAKERKFHQKLFAFQAGIFTLSYIFFIFFLNYYFFPNKFLNENNISQKGHFFSKSSLQNSLISNLSHESKFKQNLQYFIERIAVLKFKRMQKIDEKKKIKKYLNSNSDTSFKAQEKTDNKNNKEKINIQNINENINGNNEKENNLNSYENNDQNNNKEKEQTKDATEFDDIIKTPESSKTNFYNNNDFYSEEELNNKKKVEKHSSIFIFLAFQCCVALFDDLYDIVRHIIFILDFENYGNSEKSIRRNFINDIIFEIITILIELVFFFVHISYIIVNLNRSIPSIKKMHQITKSNSKNLNINSNLSNLSNISFTIKSPIDYTEAFSDFSNLMHQMQAPLFQGEVFRIAIYTPIFVMRSLILNSFYLATKLINFHKWKEMSNAIKNNLPDADEEDMKREMRCIICRLEMCTCKRKTEKRNVDKNLTKKRRRVRVKKKQKKSSKTEINEQQSKPNSDNDNDDYHFIDNKNYDDSNNHNNENSNESNINNNDASINSNDHKNEMFSINTNYNYDDSDNIDINENNSDSNNNNNKNGEFSINSNNNDNDSINLSDNNNDSAFNDSKNTEENNNVNCSNISDDDRCSNDLSSTSVTCVTHKDDDDNDEYEYEYEYDECSGGSNDDNVEFVINKGEVKKLPCGHCFHAQCLQNWSQRQMKCPLCQYDMKNILNRSIIDAQRLHPDLFRRNNRINPFQRHREIVPNMFVPEEFARNENENIIINNNNNRRRNAINEEDNHIQALRVLTQLMLILTFVLLVLLIALMFSILLDVIDL